MKGHPPYAIGELSNSLYTHTTYRQEGNIEIIIDNAEGQSSRGSRPTR